MRLLERHRARRRQNLPTITCFVGPIEEARRAFADGRAIIELETDDVARAYASRFPKEVLLRHALELVSRSAGRSIDLLVSELPAKSTADRAVFFRAIDLPDGVEELMSAWCEGRALPELDPSGLAGIVPSDAWPALFMAPSDQALISLASLVEELPFLEVGVVIDQAALRRVPPRVASMLEEGLIQPLEGMREHVRRLVTEADDPEQAKSAAELFLFEVLESMPETRGLFALNARMDFTFGRARAEIDLAAGSRRIAIEVDGYFHFQDAEAYRRDRRKDLLLQTHGWLVLRFLAEDVVVRLEETLATIRHALTVRGGIDS